MMMMRICIPFLLLAMALVVGPTAIEAANTLRLRLDDEFGVDQNPLGVEQNISPMPTVLTSSGKVVGVREEIDGLRTYSFMGIPYAGDTSGPNRWRAPRDPASWAGDDPRNATAYGAICPQESSVDFDAITSLTGVEADITVHSLPPSEPLLMSEDCLRINVFSPSLNQSAKAPVMLYIHGGGFSSGSGNAYPSFPFVANDVILVTFNYRLNMLGYLAHPSLQATNFGFLDQIKALQWVKENIENFGGDPGRITIFGEGVGGTSVLAMLVSPLSEGLFQGAISESGTLVQSLNLTMSEASSVGTAVGEVLGIPAGSDQLEAMRALPAESFTNSNMEIRSALGGSFPLFLYVDGSSLETSIGEAFNSPAEANCYHKKIPLIIGANANEMSFFEALQEDGSGGEDSTAFRSSSSNSSASNSHFLGDFSFFPDTIEAYEQAVTDTFQNNAYEVRSLFPASTDESALQAGMEIKSAAIFGYPAFFVAKTIAEQGGNAYLYHFSEKPAGEAGEHLGTFHTSELPYVFNTTTSSSQEGGHNNRDFLAPVANPDLARTIVTYWTAFAHTGDPNQGSLPVWKGMKSCPTCRYSTRQSAKAKWNLLGDSTECVAVPWKHEESYKLTEPLTWQMINGEGTWFESQSA
jgi:carboxylesterase type B